MAYCHAGPSLQKANRPDMSPSLLKPYHVRLAIRMKAVWSCRSPLEMCLPNGIIPPDLLVVYIYMHFLSRTAKVNKYPDFCQLNITNTQIFVMLDFCPIRKPACHASLLAHYTAGRWVAKHSLLKIKNCSTSG